MKKLIILIAVLFLFPGCDAIRDGLGYVGKGINSAMTGKNDEFWMANQHFQAAVRPGMTHEQVTQVLGEPNTVKAFSKYTDSDETWGYYLDQDGKTTRRDQSRYYGLVLFGNGRVVETGIDAYWSPE